MNDIIETFIQAKINLTTRDSYIAWRSEWRSHYRDLSIEIRGLKVAIKAAFREGDCAYAKQRALGSLRLQATGMLVLRADQKKLSAERRQALLAAQAA